MWTDLFGHKSKCEPAHSPNDAVHCVLDNLEFRDATLLALDMLAKRAEGPELHAAKGRRANIYFLLVTRAREMLIEGSKGVIRPVAKDALIHTSVPRCPSGIVLHFLRRVATSDETGRIGDDMILVVLDDITVNSGTVNSRATAT
jgi:hypothetical protein